MKRILSLILVLSLISSIFIMPVSAAAEQSGILNGKFSWSIDSKGTFTLKGTGRLDIDSWNDEEVDKWYELIYSATMQKVKKLVIGEGIVNIPDGFLGDNEGGMYWNSLKSVVLPQTLKEIGSGCFGGGGFKEIKIPKNVSSIGEHSFKGQKLESILVDAENQYYTSVSGVLFTKNKNELVKYPANRKGGYAIPSTTETIRSSAFEGNLNLKSITIPHSISEIGEYAFAYSEKLKTVSLNADIDEIKYGTFECCYKLKDINISDTVVRIGEAAFWGCEDLTNVKLPCNLKVIGDHAFSYTSLKKISLPTSLTEIGSHAFEDANFKEIEVPADVQTLSGGVFYGCKALKKVILHEGLQSIEGSVFADCNNLESIEIPSTVIELGDWAFSGCAKLKNIVLPQNMASIGKNSFSSCKSITTISLPKALTTIPYSAFKNCTSLSSIAIPKSVSTIGQSAFENCSALNKVEMPLSINDVVYKAFYNCGVKEVHYAGSETEWKSIYFGSYNTSIKNAKIYYGRDTADLTTLFSNSAYEYNHTLAKESFNLAVSGFSADTKDFTGSGGNNSPVAKKRYADIKARYDKLDFDVQNFYNYGTALTDTSDKAAYSIASRDIEINGTTKRLIALVVRGGGYGGEWVSNFNVGTSDTYSEGFKKPADTIAAALKSYINKYSSQEIILWMTSYSRGAAITNLIAGEMDNYADSIDNLSRENIYTYTFATPMPVKVRVVDADNEKYNNIFSIISQNDAVPCVLLSQWGFGRYGITKTFYSNATTGVKNYYKNWTKENYPIPSGQREAVSGVVDLLSKIVGSKDNFNKNYQSMVQDIVNWKMVFDKTRTEKKTLVDYGVWKYGEKWHSEYKSVSKTVNSYSKALRKAGLDEKYIDCVKEYGTLCELNGTDVSAILDDVIGNNLGKTLSRVLKGFNIYSSVDGNLGELGTAHEPDVYRSWLYSDSDTSKIFIQPYEAPDLSASYGGKYKTQLIHCPVDVTVTDKDGNVVVSVVNHEILIDELPTVVTDDKVKIFYYDNFDEYTTTMTAYDDGVVNYYVSEYAGDGTESRRICYTDITVKADESLVGEINDEIGTEASNYDLLLGENGISSTDIINTDSLENLSVDISIVGSGMAPEIKNASRGDYVTLTAEPYVGAEFIGWYSGEDLVSSELEYSFCIEENLELIAKFTEATADIFAISSPIESDTAVECEAYVEAIKVISSGTLKFNAYKEDVLQDTYSCTVNMEGGSQGHYIASFRPNENIDKITVCLYDSSNTAITKELSLNVFNDEIPVYEKDGYRYTFITEDTIEIVGVKENTVVSVEIPEKIDDYTVVSIANNTFADSLITDIILPGTIMSVKENAFSNCNDLSSVFYYGNQEDFEHIIIGDGNESFINATIICEYDGTMIDGAITETSYSNGSITLNLEVEYCYKDSIAIVNVYDDSSEDIVASKEEIIYTSDSDKEIKIPLTADDKAYNLDVFFSDVSNEERKYEITLSSAVFAEVPRYTTDDFEYIVDESGNAVITEYIGDEEDILLPAALDAHNVIGVAENEFSGNMKTLRIGANIKKLENNPFLNCLLLENIIVDDENTEFASVDGVLYNKAKTVLKAYPYAMICENFSVPDGVESIGAYAMSGTKELGQVVLSDTIKSICDYSFSGSSVTGTLILPKTLVSIGLNAFSESNIENINVSEENEIFSSIDGVLYDKTKSELISYPSGRTDDYYLVPEGTKIIKSNAFCSGEITYLAIPSSLEKFEDLCFNDFWFSYMLYCDDEDSWNNITIGENEYSEYWDIRYNYNPDSRIDAEIESAVDNGETISVSLNYNYSYQPHSLYVAAYDKDGRLIDLKNDIFSEWDEPGNLSFEFDYGENVVPHKVKVFFFESINTIKPLRNALEAGITKSAQ